MRGYGRIVIDKRHVRAQQITALLMHTISQHVDFDKLDPDGKNYVRRDLARALQEQLWCDGAQMITEGDRIAAGLPPRNPEGLTVDELHVIEARTLMLMLTPPTMIVPADKLP